MPCELLLSAARSLSEELAPLRFAAPVTHIYNPLDYAIAGYESYLRRFATGPKRVVFLGMNPGPWGMAQTGVPFGNVDLVREWLGIEAPVGRPANEHPKRPVLGLASPRKEVSGQRLWGAVKDHFETPERFFERNFIANYCPLMFMEETGRNRTPDRLSSSERKALYEVCDRHLVRLAAALRPEWVIGIGGFAAERAKCALAGTGIRLGRIMHPSPANPQTNRGWPQAVSQELKALGICPL